MEKMSLQWKEKWRVDEWEEEMIMEKKQDLSLRNLRKEDADLPMV